MMMRTKKKKKHVMLVQMRTRSSKLNSNEFGSESDPEEFVESHRSKNAQRVLAVENETPAPRVAAVENRTPALSIEEDNSPKFNPTGDTPETLCDVNIDEDNDGPMTYQESFEEEPSASDRQLSRENAGQGVPRLVMDPSGKTYSSLKTKKFLMKAKRMK